MSPELQNLIAAQPTETPITVSGWFLIRADGEAFLRSSSDPLRPLSPEMDIRVLLSRRQLQGVLARLPTLTGNALAWIRADLSGALVRVSPWVVLVCTEGSADLDDTAFRFVPWSPTEGDAPLG